jgi:hypothetical protein
MRERREQYERMRDAGHTPAVIYRAAKEGGLTRIACFALLRRLFGFSLVQAKEVVVAVDEGIALDEHQRRIADALASAGPNGLEADEGLPEQADG